VGDRVDGFAHDIDYGVIARDAWLRAHVPIVKAHPGLAVIPAYR
jgi:hypothetical protein